MHRNRLLIEGVIVACLLLCKGMVSAEQKVYEGKNNNFSFTKVKNDDNSVTFHRDFDSKRFSFETDITIGGGKGISVRRSQEIYGKDGAYIAKGKYFSLSKGNGLSVNREVLVRGKDNAEGGFKTFDLNRQLIFSKDRGLEFGKYIVKVNVKPEGEYPVQSVIENSVRRSFKLGDGYKRVIARIYAPGDGTLTGIRDTLTYKFGEGFNHTLEPFE